jgi:hypothetical protein
MGWSCAATAKPTKLPLMIALTPFALANTTAGALGETVLLPYDLVIKPEPAKRLAESCDELWGNEPPPPQKSPPA